MVLLQPSESILTPGGYKDRLEFSLQYFYKWFANIFGDGFQLSKLGLRENDWSKTTQLNFVLKD